MFSAKYKVKNYEILKLTRYNIYIQSDKIKLFSSITLKTSYSMHQEYKTLPPTVLEASVTKVVAAAVYS